MMQRASLAVDAVAALFATIAALGLRGPVAAQLGLDVTRLTGDWPLALPVLAVLVVYSAAGLYQQDAYSSRPLHAWTIVSASAWAFVLAAAGGFLIGPGWTGLPQLTLVLAFVVFTLLDLPLRLVAAHRLYASWVERQQPTAYVVGDSPESRRISTRLASLRGFTRVRTVARNTPASSWAEALLASLEGQRPHSTSVDSVFIDGGSLSPREAMEVIGAAQDRGARVYVASGLLGPLEGGRLLRTLFQAPVTRVRRRLGSRPGYASKRALDILGSAAALLLLSPVIAVLSALVKVSSPGPVFLTQTRVGRSGVAFGFLKFRSMYADCDSTCHEQYVHSLINGEVKPTATDREGNGIFHIVDDPRITPIGRFMRRYSLDEIPQLWNVLRGDMSLVGPRPPLPYEAAEYDAWQRQRLQIQSGVTGVWQVAGRNRVDFDEMTFQDLMYGMNTCLWVDIKLCLRTIPAAVLGTGI